MNNFKKLPSRAINGGIGYTAKFSNGYGASIVRHFFSYGNKSGLWELAILNSEGDICYDTPITDDVLGHLSEEKVNSTLDAIEALPTIE